MPKALFRFYEELNDFLPEEKRKTDFEVSFGKNTVLKDIIQRIGVPHKEIDLILVNGKSQALDYMLQDDDRISIYPVFERLNIKSITRLSKRPLRKTKFIADVNMENLVVYMRKLGLDVYFDAKLSSRDIIKISKDENRIILTTNRALLSSGEITHCIFLRHGTIQEQVVMVLDTVDIRKPNPGLRKKEDDGSL